MPAIEIVCVGQKRPTRFRGLPLAVLAEGGKLRSHRQPSHFQLEFDRLSGCIYHLGCPHLRRNRTGPYEAYAILSKECHDQWPTMRFLHFDPHFVPSIRNLLTVLLNRSPAARVVFTSDCKFSPLHARRVENISLREFWDLHRNHRLRFNTLYGICSDRPIAADT